MYKRETLVIKSISSDVQLSKLKSWPHLLAVNYEVNYCISLFLNFFDYEKWIIILPTSYEHGKDKKAYKH